MNIGEMKLLDPWLVWRNEDATNRNTGQKLVCLGVCHKDRRECGASVLGYGVTYDEALLNAGERLKAQYKMLDAMDAAGVPVVNLLGQKV